MNTKINLHYIIAMMMLALLSPSAIAKISMSRLFSDNMILQQKQKNRIWGWADQGQEITVKASWGAKETAQVNADGAWQVFLDTPKFGTGFSLSISDGKETLKIKEVAIGEVWLCAGQSNMGWAVGGTFEKEGEANTNLPDLRIFSGGWECSNQPRKKCLNRLAKWLKATPESIAGTSAVSYYFGKKLHQELGVPVGILVKAYSGTPIEGWMPRDIQKDDPRTQALMEKTEAQDAIWSRRAKSTKKELLLEFDKKLIEYNESIDQGITTYKKRNKIRTLAPPSVRGLATHAFQYPGNIYNAMIYPIRGYGIKGMVWYQGERNSKYADQACHYRSQLSLMINFYRKTWNKLSGGNNDANFPVQITQLPSWNPVQKVPVEGVEATWAITREMMRLATKDLPNVSISVAIDTGDTCLLHPMNKKPVGLRHAYLALKQTYGKDIVAHGPFYTKQTMSGDKITLHFDSVGGGLMAAKPSAINSFAIAGKDKVWHWADAKVVGDTVEVSSKQVSHPVAVRYAWAMNPSQRNLLYNKEGLPATPFRTDDWPLFEEGTDLPKVIKPKKPKGYKPADWARPKMIQ